MVTCGDCLWLKNRICERLSWRDMSPGKDASGCKCFLRLARELHPRELEIRTLTERALIALSGIPIENLLTAQGMVAADHPEHVICRWPYHGRNPTWRVITVADVLAARKALRMLDPYGDGT